MTYEYLCQACGHQWEAEQSISADPLKDCPACGQAEAKRQISLGGGFILKGGGWYSDLYASSSAKDGKSGEASESKGSEAKPSETTASASKPASESGSAKSDSSSSSPATSSTKATSSAA